MAATAHSHDTGKVVVPLLLGKLGKTPKSERKLPDLSNSELDKLFAQASRLDAYKKDRKTRR